MKIVAISDTHMMHENIVLPEGDLLIHAGDCTNDGTEDETRRFLKWFRAQPHKHKVFVPGNHDDYVEAHPEVAQGKGVEMLWDRSITIEGLKIYGSPYRTVPEERMKQQAIRWSAFMTTETWAQLIWRDIPDGLDVLITHQPCYGIADYALKQRWGSPALLDAVNRARPRVHVFGHVHSGHGIIDKGPHETKRVNAAQCGDDFTYWLQWRPISFDLEPRDEQPMIVGV